MPLYFRYVDDTSLCVYIKSTYSGRVLNFTSNHPIQNKVAIIKNLVDRAVCLSHELFHSGNLDFVKKSLSIQFLEYRLGWKGL